MSPCGRMAVFHHLSWKVRTLTWGTQQMLQNQPACPCFHTVPNQTIYGARAVHAWGRGRAAQVHGDDAMMQGHHCIIWPQAPTGPATLLFPLNHFMNPGYSLLSYNEIPGTKELGNGAEGRKRMFCYYNRTPPLPR